MTNNPYSLNISVSFGNINKDFKPLFSYTKDIIGWILPDGRIVRPLIAFEVEDGDKHANITSEVKMSDLGFEDLTYHDISFEQ